MILMGKIKKSLHFSCLMLENTPGSLHDNLPLSEGTTLEKLRQCLLLLCILICGWILQYS